jgi:membrane-bound lytic murein transglycosylase D
MEPFRTLTLCSSLALVALLAGCGSVRPQPVYSTFLPPSPEPLRPTVVIAEPPEIEPRFELRSSSHALIVQHGGARPNRSELLAREAQWHFQAGRKHYQDGDIRSARREFDRAVDLLLSAPDDEASGSLEAALEPMVEAIHRLDLAGMGSGDSGEPRFERAPIEELAEMTFPVDPRLKDKVVDEVRATVSQLPLEVTDPVLSYVNYFSTERGRRMLAQGLRRAGRYRPLIQRILDEEGVPQELMFIAQAESAFLPRAVSRKKATEKKTEI